MLAIRLHVFVEKNYMKHSIYENTEHNIHVKSTWLVFVSEQNLPSSQIYTGLKRAKDPRCICVNYIEGTKVLIRLNHFSIHLISDPQHTHQHKQMWDRRALII